VPDPAAVKASEREEDLVHDLLDSGLVEPVERDESEQIARGQRKDEGLAVGAVQVVVQLVMYRCATRCRISTSRWVWNDNDFGTFIATTATISVSVPW
jgi:hypothetical protein